MTNAINRPRVLPCPLNDVDGIECHFTVTLPEPEPGYRPTWLPSVRRDMFASEQAEVWSAEFREHLRAEHTVEQLLWFVSWEPHRVWTEEE